MIENLNPKQLQAILDAFPFEMMFVDENDLVQFGNKIETRKLQFKKDKINGRNLRYCMTAKTQPKLEKILADFKSGEAKEAEFWMPSLTGKGKALNRFIALHDKNGKYLGILEYVLDFTVVDEIAEEKKDAPWREKQE